MKDLKSSFREAVRALVIAAVLSCAALQGASGQSVQPTPDPATIIPTDGAAGEAEATGSPIETFSVRMLSLENLTFHRALVTLRGDGTGEIKGDFFSAREGVDSTLSTARALTDLEYLGLNSRLDFLRECADPPFRQVFDFTPWVFKYAGPANSCEVKMWTPSIGKWPTIGRHLVETAGLPRG